jgi:osmotically-inducible protein OsmY
MLEMNSVARLAVVAIWSLGLCGCFQDLSGVDVSDSGIKDRIESQFQVQRGLDTSHLDLDVHNRIVTVSGLARSWNEKIAIEKIVRRTPGVEQTVLNIVISE